MTQLTEKDIFIWLTQQGHISRSKTPFQGLCSSLFSLLALLQTRMWQVSSQNLILNRPSAPDLPFPNTVITGSWELANVVLHLRPHCF